MSIQIKFHLAMNSMASHLKQYNQIGFGHELNSIQYINFLLYLLARFMYIMEVLPIKPSNGGCDDYPY